MKRHLLEAADLDRDDATLVLDTAAQIESALAGREVKKLPTLRGRTVVNLFYEDSTRTRISFELAAKRLSADVINFSAKGSSVSKGESLKDTALTLEAMGSDAIVVRHPASGAPHRLAQLGAGQRGQRRRRHPRAPDPGAAGRVHDPAAAGPARRRAGGHRRRRAAQPGGPLQRLAAAHAGRRGHPRRAADAAAGGRRAAGRSTVVLRPGRRAAQGRRGDDAAGAAERMNASFFPSAREYSRRYGLDAGGWARWPTTRSSCTPAR